MQQPDYDLVVFGATSFVGKILVQALSEHSTVEPGIRWAIAGRSESRLQAVRDALGAGSEAPPLIVADAGDEEALAAMCRQTRVVISTVGPYALYGDKLVKTCVDSGTDYCDLTGEVQWMRRMLDRHEATARQNGARIIHCCGFDSVPSDLGVYHLQQHAREQFGRPCREVHMRVKAMRGGLSGGTVASMINVARELSANPALRREIASPYAICPRDFGGKTRQSPVTTAVYDADLQRWVAPFVMATINERVVLRSQALLSGAYGEAFVYNEAMATGSGLAGRWRAVLTSAGTRLWMLAAALRLTRALLEKWVVPKPGEGPDEEAQRNGFFQLAFFGVTPQGDRLVTRVSGERDPGYGATARMLAQCALCLARDVPVERLAGGFWTPASALGEPLLKRLQDHAGMRFEVDTVRAAGAAD